MITLIAACSRNRVIGKDNTLIWNVPGDLKRFKELTTGHPVLMGRKTFDSIGRPLPNRTNIVITRNTEWSHPGVITYQNWRDALPIFENQKLFVIGGGEIYQQLMPYADEILLTYIDRDYEGDSFFPEIGTAWKMKETQKMTGQEFDWEYQTFIRKSDKCKCGNCSCKNSMTFNGAL